MSTMPTQITSLDQVDQTLLATTIANYVEMLQEEDSTLDTNPATVLRQMVVELQALFGALTQTQVNRLVNSWSLAVINADPTLADDALVDKLVSNYMIVRNSGTFASGSVVIVLQSLITTAIPGSLQFTDGSNIFQVTRPFLGVISADAVTDSGDRLIQTRDDGTFYFTVEVTAVAAGAASQLQQNTSLTSTPNIPASVRMYAEADFTGGTDPETNAQLMSRLAAGISAQSTADATSIEGIIRGSFPAVTQVSILGFGDPEMSRDRNNLLGISTGGKVDIIVRTAVRPSVTKITKTAVLDSTALQSWRLQFQRTENSGFYYVQAVLPTGSTAAGSLDITSDSRLLDVTSLPGMTMPSIPKVENGIYSPFQTACVKFIDPGTPVTGLTEGSSTGTYDVYVVGMPSLWDIQTSLFSLRSRRDPAGDYLIRAPIPCILTANLLIRYDARYAAPVASAVSNAVADAVNALDFTVPNLPISKLVEAAHSVLNDTAYVELPIDVRGKLFLPDGQTIHLTGTQSIDIPTFSTYGVSRRTTAFFMSPTDVVVTLVASSQV